MICNLCLNETVKCEKKRSQTKKKSLKSSFANLGNGWKRIVGIPQLSADLDLRCASGLKSFSSSFNYSVFLPLERRKWHRILLLLKTVELGKQSERNAFGSPELPHPHVTSSALLAQQCLQLLF